MHKLHDDVTLRTEAPSHRVSVAARETTLEFVRVFSARCHAARWRSVAIEWRGKSRSRLRCLPHPNMLRAPDEPITPTRLATLEDVVRQVILVAGFSLIIGLAIGAQTQSPSQQPPQP